MCASRMDQESQSVLAYWWMLELLSPQKVPKITRRSTRPANHQVIEWSPGQPLPWYSLPEPTSGGTTEYVWQHTVFLGIYEVQETYKSLLQVFGEDPDAYDERPNQQSACAGLMVDHAGRIIEESAILSTALWAVARLRHGGANELQWTAEFDATQQHFVKLVDNYIGGRRDLAGAEQPSALDDAAICALLNIAQDTAGISEDPALATPRIIIDSRAILLRRAEDANHTDFLNSFYLQDLAALRSQAAHGNVGTALEQYLMPDRALGQRDRIDIVARPDVVDEKTDISQLPKGRWPSDPTHGLALSQQFAVNRALNELGPSSGLVGVNGPPGTGKTTMLRDVLAGNVVERARRLAALQQPKDAFTGHYHTWQASTGHGRKLPQLRPELIGFEMIVASANNAAVENISQEIPAAKAIAAIWRGKADYFSEIATAVLRTSADLPASENSEEATAWGLVAARLGKKKNRSKFYSAFWFGKGQDDRKGTEVTVEGMQTRLKKWAEDNSTFPSWQEARATFAAAQRRVDQLIAERQKAAEHLARLPETLDRQHKLKVRGGTLQDDLARLKTQHRELAAVKTRAHRDVSLAEAAYDRHVANKPGALEILFTLGSTMRQWRSELAPLETTLTTATQQHDEVTDQTQRIRQDIEAIQTELAEIDDQLLRARAQYERLEAQCAEDGKRYGPNYPGPTWSGEQRELHTPWLDAELDTARSELFLAALKLHQDFMANAASEMRQGLRAAVEVVAGEYPKDLASQKVRAAWQLFFLVVPLVSTTFASLGRMFGDVGKAAFGWLLIDEAGQASPQYAVGAIWRAQRVVAVGDPLQLEPVVTVPNKMRRDIAAAYGLSSTWIPPRSSVQTLADRVSVYGTTLSQGEEDIWVSAPLKVHRRCEDPMFTLCNTIAYNGMMVNGLPPHSPDPNKPDPFIGNAHQPAIAPSHWVDEAALKSGTHLQENQIRRFENALSYLKAHGVKASDVIAISPFRDVADRLRAMTAKYPGLRAGTIHTAQGREASIVFLILGGDPERPGAKTWAASSVNLVNVAASRAKRRLYVIGDRAAWSSHNYFRELSMLLN